MRNSPKISVIMPSYNHAPFIAEAIESVLNQKYDNFELLIADDCSTDNLRNIINSYQNIKIKKFFLEKNIGPTRILKFLIEESTGDYIALLNSDDVWCQNKLQKQIDFFNHCEDKNIVACFTWADFIDENGLKIEESNEFDIDMFCVKNRSRGEWFKKFYLEGNCLNHSSMLIKRKVYEELGFYNDALRQLPDMDYWTRLLFKYSFHMHEEVLVHHRRLNGITLNTSKNNNENMLRLINEYIYILKNMFEKINDEIFINSFSTLFKAENILSSKQLWCEKYFLLLNKSSLGDSTRGLALNIFMEKYSDPEIMTYFEQYYNYSFRDFYNDSSKVSEFPLLYNDTKKMNAKVYFITNQICSEEKAVIIQEKAEGSSLIFDFSPLIDCEGIRFDPIDNYAFIYKNIEIFINNKKSDISPVNGGFIEDKTLLLTKDPQLTINKKLKKEDKIKIIIYDYDIIDLNKINLLNGRLINESNQLNSIPSVFNIFDRKIKSYKNNIFIRLLEKIGKKF